MPEPMATIGPGGAAPSACPVIVLAAGRGTRIGRPKALMTTPRGEAWWRVQSQALRAVGLSPVWVVSPTVRAIFAAAPGAPAAAEVFAGDPDAPMSASLMAGVRAVADRRPTAPSVFVLPVDVPASRDPSTWRALADAGSDVSVPTFDGKRGHPVHLSWSWVAMHVLSASPEADFRLDHAIQSIARLVPVADPVVTVNLNTPDDLRRYFATLGDLDAPHAPHP